MPRDHDNNEGGDEPQKHISNSGKNTSHGRKKFRPFFMF
jgi:hypothetical protein